MDDIVADIAQEEKEEGIHPVAISSLSFCYTQTKEQHNSTLKNKYNSIGSVMGCPFSFLTLQMTLQKHAYTPTGLRGLPAAQPLVKRASG